MSSPTLTPSKLTRGYFIALSSAGILSTVAIFIRHLTDTYQIPSLVVAFWRDAFVAMTLFGVLAFLRPAMLKTGRRHLPFLIIYGLMLSLFNALWTLSVVLNGAAVSTVLAYCSAGFTALLGWWLLNERLDWSKLMAVALSLGGTVLISGAYDPAAWRSNLLGILTGTISGLMYAIYTLMGRSASQRGLNPWTTLTYTFGFAAAFLLLMNLLPVGSMPGKAVQPADLLWLGSAVAGWVVLFLLALGPTIFGYGLYNVSLTYLPASVANLVVTLEPVFTAILAYFLFHEILSGIQLVGSLMIMGAVIFLRVHENMLLKENSHAAAILESAGRSTVVSPDKAP